MPPGGSALSCERIVGIILALRSLPTKTPRIASHSLGEFLELISNLHRIGAVFRLLCEQR